MALFFGVLNVGVDQKRVGLRVDVLHHDLEPVEASCFWDLHLRHEFRSEVLEDDAVRSSEEGQHVLDEMFVVIGQFVPVLLVLSEVQFSDVPEAGHLVLVHLPDVVVLDREDHEPVGVLLEQGFGKKLLVLGLSWDCVLRVGLIVQIWNSRCLRERLLRELGWFLLDCVFLGVLRKNCVNFLLVVHN